MDLGWRLPNTRHRRAVAVSDRRQMVDRSSWKMDAAVLMAEHKGLISCPCDNDLAIARSSFTTTHGRELPAIVPPTVLALLLLGYRNIRSRFASRKVCPSPGLTLKMDIVEKVIQVAHGLQVVTESHNFVAKASFSSLPILYSRYV